MSHTTGFLAALLWEHIDNLTAFPDTPGERMRCAHVQGLVMLAPWLGCWRTAAQVTRYLVTNIHGLSGEKAVV